MWSDLSFHYWWRCHSGSDKSLSREEWGVSQWETVFGCQTMCTLAHLQPGLAQVCSDCCLDYNLMKHIETQTSFPIGPRISQDLVIHVVSTAEKLFHARALTWMWLNRFSSLRQIWDHINKRYMRWSTCHHTCLAMGSFVLGCARRNISLWTEEFFMDHRCILGRKSEDRGKIWDKD